jgi:hypothetical protein
VIEALDRSVGTADGRRWSERDEALGLVGL